MRWLLPEHIEDILPAEAMRIEIAAPRASWICSSVHRLRTGHAAAGRVHRLAADRHRARPGPAHLQAGGPALGPDDGRARRHHAAGGAHRRAPAQPQGRDAPVLLRQRAARAAGERPAATREPIQIGAEIFGHAGIASDLEIQGLLCQALAVAGVQGRAHGRRPRRGVPLAGAGGRRSAHELEVELFEALQKKDVPALKSLTRTLGCENAGRASAAARPVRRSRCPGARGEKAAAASGSAESARHPARAGEGLPDPGQLRPRRAARLPLPLRRGVRRLLRRRRAAPWRGAGATTRSARPSAGRARRPGFRSN